MNTNLKDLLAKLGEIAHLPSIFKSVLENENEEFLVPGEVILDTVFVEREGYDFVGTTLRKFDSWTPGTLVVVTNFGISILREGGLKVSESTYGYNVHHTVFEKISSLTLEVGLLNGTLTVSTSTSVHPDIRIDFNTAFYSQEFERLIRLIRNRVFLASRQRTT